MPPGVTDPGRTDLTWDTDLKPTDTEYNQTKLDDWNEPKRTHKQTADLDAYKIRIPMTCRYTSEQCVQKSERKMKTNVQSGKTSELKAGMRKCCDLLPAF